ncbi:MAG TPA: FmdB family zinc ribbon protein [Bryobacteraceae bacterium]|nr:FmdB family zinc ribbon protein [Bryobacteraceae bacterium]
MPLYEYSCHRCGEHFEVRQKFADEPLKVHEGCGGDVERLLSAPALQFKGTGWYVTDYARNGRSPSNGSNGSESKSDKSEKKTETPKSESKAGSKPAQAEA